MLNGSQISYPTRVVQRVADLIRVRIDELGLSAKVTVRDRILNDNLALAELFLKSSRFLGFCG